MNDLVIVKDGVPMVSSDLVAKKFGKVHRDVMRSINNLECSEEFSLRNFAQSTYVVRGKNYDCYLMTRDGFAFLCMGFTGKEAAQWKEKYIEAFNEMESSLKEDSKIEDRMNKIAIEGRELKELGSEWSELGRNIGKAKKEHKKKAKKLIDDVQMGMEFEFTKIEGE